MSTGSGATRHNARNSGLGPTKGLSGSNVSGSSSSQYTQRHNHGNGPKMGPGSRGMNGPPPRDHVGHPSCPSSHSDTYAGAPQNSQQQQGHYARSDGVPTRENFERGTGSHGSRGRRAEHASSDHSGGNHDGSGHGRSQTGREDGRKHSSISLRFSLGRYNGNPLLHYLADGNLDGRVEKRNEDHRTSRHAKRGGFWSHETYTWEKTSTRKS